MGRKDASNGLLPGSDGIAGDLSDIRENPDEILSPKEFNPLGTVWKGMESAPIGNEPCTADKALLGLYWSSGIGR